MGHNGCDGSQASGPWAIGSRYRFTIRNLAPLSMDEDRPLRWHEWPWMVAIWPLSPPRLASRLAFECGGGGLNTLSDPQGCISNLGASGGLTGARKLRPSSFGGSMTRRARSSRTILGTWSTKPGPSGMGRTYPLPFGGSQPLQSGGQHQQWSRNGPGGYITRAN